MVRRLAACLSIILISVAVAPLIGAGAFFIVQVAVQAVTTGVDDLLGLLVLFVIGAYIVGGPIALIAGSLVSLVAWWETPSLIVIILAIVVANVVIMLLQPMVGFGLAGFLINVASSLFSGIVCWLLFRRPLHALGLHKLP